MDNATPALALAPPDPLTEKAQGVTVNRFHTQVGVHPASQVQWEKRTAKIKGEDGASVFEQTDIECPKSWSELALNVVASKYFRGLPGSPQRENSVRGLIERVASTITIEGEARGYFDSPYSRDAFYSELFFLLVNQHAAFNSPVWFNVGVEMKPQCSACFINSVNDSMESILGLAKTEGMLFKFGSGTGSNLSSIRSSKEKLRGGGDASGPVSFMRGFDAFAGVIKSGGKTRRAAKMVMLNADHPDIEEFIACKMLEEKKAHALIDAGYDGSFNGEAYGSIFFQNSNNSVRFTDEQMSAAVHGGKIALKAVTTGLTLAEVEGRDLFRRLAEAAHMCGDPGVQFDTTINDWHTCPDTARINGSNPCSEYMFLDDSACNLASINLMKYRRPDGTFDVRAFRHAVDILILAQEIIVAFSSYPTEAIEKNSHDYRPLGLGYANLGALLMSLGLPYDSDAGREMAAALTAIMTGRAYVRSAQIARARGPFAGFAANRESMLRVMNKHRSAARRLPRRDYALDALQDWDEAVEMGEQYGYRNAQATVLAPTGTIGFMMDCDTTGIEPDIALVKYKKLVGGGTMKIVNQTVPAALLRLGYGPEEVASVIAYIDAHDTIEGAPALQSEDLPVFDCAFKPSKGTRSIHWQGHIRMMGATQPFLSGAISKTVNMPTDATVEDVQRAYTLAWELGTKAIAIYRDGCKRSQPLNTGKDASKAALAARAAEVGKAEIEQLIAEAVAKNATPKRRRLPDTRGSVTHHFNIGGHDGYVTVGLYPDGTPGEMFVRMAKEGSTVSGLIDAFATMVSIALQHGVPLKTITQKLAFTNYNPSGFTPNPDIRNAHSITDYLARWLELNYGEQPEPEEAPVSEKAADIAFFNKAVEVAPEPASLPPAAAFQNQSDAPPCMACGAILVRNGACYRCSNCGSTSGCS